MERLHHRHLREGRQKKLISVVLHWCGRDTDARAEHRDLVEGAHACGIPVEDVLAAARILGDSDPDDYDEQGNLVVMEENAEAALVFLRAGTQWRQQVITGGTQIRTVWHGLDYPAVHTIMELHHVSDPRDTFERVQVMERAALILLNDLDLPLE